MNRVSSSGLGVDKPTWAARAERFCCRVLALRGQHGWELSLAFSDDASIRELNKRYRNRDEPTDVLSFSQEGGFDPGGRRKRFLAGDIVISLERLDANSRDFGVDRGEELKRLLVHGILHLSGMDHPEEDPRGPMLDLQESILKRMRKDRIV
jgi:probable rRNA maturation factor